jgi:hypothetical protein
VSDRRQPTVKGVVARFKRTVLQNAFDGYVEKKRSHGTTDGKGRNGLPRKYKKYNQTRK